MKTVVIDAGHGGDDSGAIGAILRLIEKDANLGICLRVRELLHGEMRVILTREDDTAVTLAQRSAISNEADADLFLSVHCNSSDNPQARGFEVFTTRGDTPADPFATQLFRDYEGIFSFLPARKGLGDGDPDKEAGFSVLRKTLAPAALFECAFLSNPRDEEFLASEDGKDRIADSFAGSIRTHLGLSSTEGTSQEWLIPAILPLVEESIENLRQLETLLRT